MSLLADDVGGQWVRDQQQPAAAGAEHPPRPCPARGAGGAALPLRQRLEE